MKTNKENINKRLSDIYKDIIAIKIDAKDSFATSMNKFYKVMRKWNIKQGEWIKSGSRLLCNAEWIMCFDVFRNHKILSLDLWLCLNDPPKDLLAYGKRPKVKTPKIKTRKS